MKKVIVLFLITITLEASRITPSEVYKEVAKIYKEVIILQHHFKIKKEKTTNYRHIQTNIKPRNVWQKAYIILTKINILRKNHNLPRVEEIGIEPVLNLEPDIVYGMTQRILTELRIFKKLMGIKSKIAHIPNYTDKKPIDVFNFMHKVSNELDILIGHQTVPNDVFAQVMRVYDDISTILAKLNISDNTMPPKKHKNSKPKDVFKAAFELMDTVLAIQRRVNINRIDFSVFMKKQNIKPSNVYEIIGLVLSELQPIKAQLDIKRSITPPSKHYEDKSPADVEQLIMWAKSRLELVRYSHFL